MNRFSKITLVFLLSILAATPVWSQVSGDTFAQASASKRAQMTCLYVNIPGFIAETGPNAHEGLLVDIMNDFKSYVFNQLGITLTLNYQQVANDDFAEMLEQVKTARGGVVALSNITITQARRAYYDFSVPYMSNVPVLISHPSVPELSSLRDFATVFRGKQVYIAPGTTHEARLQSLNRTHGGNLTFSDANSEQEIVERVASDPNTISSIDFIYFANSLKNKVQLKRHAVGDGESEQFGLTLPKNNDWTPVFNQFLSSGYLSNTNYRKMISDHLGYHALALLSTLEGG